MAGNIKGIIVEIGGDTSGLQKALSKVNSATSSLSRELKGINSLLKLDPSNTVLLTQKQEVLAEQITLTSEKLEELQRHEQAVAEVAEELTEEQQKNYRALQREIVNTQNKLSALKVESSKWTKAGDAMVEFGEGVSRISGKIDKLGTSLTTGITLPVAGLTATLISSAKEFETAFTGVEKTVDGTTEQLEALKKGIQDMAEEIPSSTTEIAAVAEAAGQLGIATEDILDFTKVMIDLGNSTNLSAEEAASSLAKFANVTKMSTDDYDKLGSTIVALGNNFATTEADIVSMATRLASTGELAGLSEPQILALATAMSSVGIEAEAGGSAMSKLLKQIQVAVEVGGSDLKDFARIAGMSTKQFKEAFEKDAVKALSSFISGLNATERNGKSAIAVLNDMELKEVRLSNTILSLANASDVLNNAVELGNQSWEENVALSNEANKRYETLESQMEITKNKIRNLATNLGNKLTPKFKDLLKQVDKVIDKIDDLTDEEIDNIIQTTAMVATIGPAIKILSSFGTITGNTITTLGNFSKAIANVKNGIKTAEGQVGTFTKALTLLTNPTALAVTGITALVAAFAIYAKQQSDERKALNGIRESLDEQAKSWQSLKDAREQYLTDSSTEITQLEYLKNELHQITDENGKVKQGYSERASFILNQLNNALGTEYKLNGDLIQQYQDLKTNIDEVIQSKKVEATLSAYQGEYEEAIKGQSTATENLINLRQQLNQAQADYVTGNYKERVEAQMRIAELSKAIQQETDLISQYGYTIQNYEELQRATITGTTEEITAALEQMNISWEKVGETADQSTAQQILAQQTYVEELKKSWQDAVTSNDTYQAQILKTQLDTNQKQLDSLYETLSKETSLIKELSPEQIAAYQYLAETNYTKYSEFVNKLSPDTQEQLENVTYVIVTNTSVENATGDLAEESEKRFSKNLNLTIEDTETILAKIQQTVKNDTAVEAETGQLGEDASSEFTTKADAWGVGNNYTLGLVNGINAGSGQVYGAVRNLGEQMKAQMMASLQEHSPSKATEQMGINFDLGLINGIIDSKKDVLREIERLGIDSLVSFNDGFSVDSLALDKLNSNMANKVIENSNTVFTTPQIVFNVQELDEEKLNQCFNYINRKFGSAY